MTLVNTSPSREKPIASIAPLPTVSTTARMIDSRWAASCARVSASEGAAGSGVVADMGGTVPTAET